MKRLLSMFALLLAAGCSSLHEDQPSVHFPENNQPVFHANLSNESLTYLGEDIEFSWAAKDQVSIFTGNTRNKLYEFTGETGDNAGELKYAGKNSFGFGEALNANYAIYPYSETTTIDENGDISYTWPATQTYAENGIGYGANVMVAASSSVAASSAGSYPLAVPSLACPYLWQVLPVEQVLLLVPEQVLLLVFLMLLRLIL